MMTAKEKLQRASASVAFDGIFKYIKKKPQENLLKLIDISQKFMGGASPRRILTHSARRSRMRATSGTTSR